MESEYVGRCMCKIHGGFDVNSFSFLAAHALACWHSRMSMPIPYHKMYRMYSVHKHSNTYCCQSEYPMVGICHKIDSLLHHAKINHNALQPLHTTNSATIHLVLAKGVGIEYGIGKCKRVETNGRRVCRGSEVQRLSNTPKSRSLNFASLSGGEIGKKIGPSPVVSPNQTTRYANLKSTMNYGNDTVYNVVIFSIELVFVSHRTWL